MSERTQWPVGNLRLQFSGTVVVYPDGNSIVTRSSKQANSKLWGQKAKILPEFLGAIKRSYLHFHPLFPDHVFLFVCFLFCLFFTTGEMEPHMKPSRTVWDSWAQKPFCVPHSLFVGNRLQPPWLSLSSKGQIQRAANQGREGMQTREEQPRNNSAALGQGPGSPQRIHITISLSSLQN